MIYHAAPPPPPQPLLLGFFDAGAGSGASQPLLVGAAVCADEPHPEATVVWLTEAAAAPQLEAVGAVAVLGTVIGPGSPKPGASGVVRGSEGPQPDVAGAGAVGSDVPHPEVAVSAPHPPPDSVTSPASSIRC